MLETYRLYPISIGTRRHDSIDFRWKEFCICMKNFLFPKGGTIYWLINSYENHDVFQMSFDSLTWKNKHEPLVDMSWAWSQSEIKSLIRYLNSNHCNYFIEMIDDPADCGRTHTLQITTEPEFFAQWKLTN